MTVTNKYANYCTNLSYNDLDDHTVDYTKKLVLDTIGTSIGGFYWSDTGDIMVKTGQALRVDQTNGTATILATGNRSSPSNAALVNGALSHSLDYDNRHSEGAIHIGSSVVTAAIAAAENVDANGKELVEGIVAGYDIAARLGMACNPPSSHERGFHPTSTCGIFGATAAIGIIYGLKAQEIEAAFGVNASLASGTSECFKSGGWNKRIHPGLAAKNAFVSIAFARNGFQGPTTPISGEHGFLHAYADHSLPERAASDLGKVYEVTQTKIKPYPVGTYAHVPISLLIDLVEKENINPDSVEQVCIEIPTRGAKIFARSEDDTHPVSSVEAQFDMPFCAALAITHGEASLAAFDDSISGEYTKTFAHLMEATTTYGDDDLEKYLPELYPGRVTIMTENETYKSFRKWVHGEPNHPFSWGDIRVKFNDLAIEFDNNTKNMIVRNVRNIESISCRELLEPLYTNIN